MSVLKRENYNINMPPFPSISVVIPAYNRAKTIGRCLDSVLAQTAGPLEILVVDDCSTDETARIVQRYEDSGVRCIIQEKNAGAQAARNRGIREAKGDWIAFQDSDDEWLPTKLEKQLRMLEQSGFDPWTVVHANGFQFDEATGRRRPMILPLVDGDDVYPALLCENGPIFQAMLVSRRALEEIGYLDEQVPSFQEWDTAIRLARRCRFRHVQEPLFVYHFHGGEAISKNDLNNIRGYQYIIDKFRDEIIRVSGPEAWERHLFVQLRKCLGFRLWNEADRYFDQIKTRSLRYWYFKLLRLLRVSVPVVLWIGA